MNTTEIDRNEIIRIYGKDPRDLPLYSISEASRYLKLHPMTLRSWVLGRQYTVGEGTQRWWNPVVKLPDAGSKLLSFTNLVELHVLSGIRRIHQIQFRKVRAAISYLEEIFTEEHPLATVDFWTDKFDLFVERSGILICASLNGQIVLRGVVQQYLDRVERDIDLKPLRLYPFSKELTFRLDKKENNLTGLGETPKTISIDPLVGFGRPTVSGTGVPTNVIAGRFKAGDDIGALSDDYGIEEEKIEQALDFEGVRRAA